MDKTLLAAVCAAALLLTACKPKPDDVIRVDQVPKEVPAAPIVSAPLDQSTNPNLADLPPGHPPIPNGSPDLGTPTMTAPAGSGGMQALPGMAEFTAATATPKWTPPANWVVETGDAMRKGSWKTPGDNPADISVNVFQGTLGGLLANVNRWRGQVGLSPDLTDANLGQNVQNITVDGRPAQLVTLDGPDNQSMSGLLVFLPDRVWTIKMSGPTKAVQAERADFRDFLDTIKWQD